MKEGETSPSMTPAEIAAADAKARVMLLEWRGSNPLCPGHPLRMAAHFAVDVQKLVVTLREKDKEIARLKEELRLVEAPSHPQPSWDN